MRYAPASCSKCNRTTLAPLEPRARLAVLGGVALADGPATAAAFPSNWDRLLASHAFRPAH